MGIGQPKLVVLLIVSLLGILSSLQAVYAIRFVIDRDECFSHDVKYSGDTVYVGFNVIKTETYWSHDQQAVDFVVKGPHGEQIHDGRDKVSDKFYFVGGKGVYHFCFTNKSPYHETIDFDVRESHFQLDSEHLKDEHLKPVLEELSKLESSLFNVHFEQNWMSAQMDQRRIAHEATDRKALYKAIWESAALVGASSLQIYLLRRLFNKKLAGSVV
ncbi:hypothetical protein ACFE04_022775 [Oxalis oulophora]